MNYHLPKHNYESKRFGKITLGTTPRGFAVQELLTDITDRIEEKGIFPICRRCKHSCKVAKAKGATFVKCADYEYNKERSKK